MKKTKFEEIIETINKVNDEGKLNVFLAIWGVTEMRKFYENRTCKNCKHYNPAYKMCENKRNIQPFKVDNEYVNMFTDDDFGCNRVERKEDEKYF